MENSHWRRNRKLPNVCRATIGAPKRQPAPNSKAYWHSCKSALSWMRKHQGILTEFVEILQMYPYLIQDSSMDQFWDFIQPMIAQDRRVQENVQLFVATPAKVAVGEGNMDATKGSSNPRISISGTPTRETSTSAPTPTVECSRTPRIHVISHHDLDMRRPGETNVDSVLHFGILDMLQEEFYIRVANPSNSPCGTLTPKAVEDSCLPQRDRKQLIEECDVCVYVFNDTTLKDAGCFHDLCVAFAIGVPVVYVKRFNQDLPNSFSDHVRFNSKGCVSLGEYVDTFVFKHRSSLPSKMKHPRTNPRLTPLTAKTRPLSAHELAVKGVEVKKNICKQSTSTFNVDLLLHLINSFKTACVFDENHLSSCRMNLRTTILQAMNTNETERQTLSHKISQDTFNSTGQDINMGDTTKLNIKPQQDNNSMTQTQNPKALLRVPTANRIASSRDFSISGSVSAPPSSKSFDQGHRFMYDVRKIHPARLEQKATTYLVFGGKNTTGRTRRIHFPFIERELADDCGEMELDEFDPGGSPINFHEIDLARRVNEVRDTPDSEISSF